MFLLLIAIIIFTYIVHYKMGRKKLVELSKKLPSDLPALPILGHAYLFTGTDEDTMKSIQKSGKIALKHGGLATFWMANQLYLVVADPAASEVLLKNCLEKDNNSMRFLQFLVGNGSIYSSVSIWRPRRKLLAPTFNTKKLNRFVDVFAKQSAIMVEQLRPSVGKGTISVWKYLTTYTFDSVCETTLGVQMNAQSQPNHPFLEAFDEIAELMSRRMVRPWLHPDWLYRILPHYQRAERCRRLIYDFVDNVIKLKRQEMEAKQREANYLPKSDSYLGFQSLLEMLLETSLKVKGFTDLELREETLVMSAAGTDTSAVGASFALVMLSRHPEVQEKVFEELHEVLEYGDKAVTAADLPRLKYLDAVVKETLRLYPPVPIIVRLATSDTELQSGVIIPEGTSILLNIWAIHRDPRYWGPDADIFKPERFFEPLTHPAQFMPFSYGLRNCLGYLYAMMSMKTVLATFLRQYRVLPPAGADPKTLKEPIRVKYEIMMKAVDKFQLQIEPRTPQVTRTIG
ncbi:cytochrome P450 4d2-like [Choristoneura fumiferana]